LLFAIASVYLGKIERGGGSQGEGRWEKGKGKGRERQTVSNKQKTGTRRVFLDYFFLIACLAKESFVFVHFDNGKVHLQLNYHLLYVYRKQINVLYFEKSA
jgi:hypothetical protein